MPIAILSRASAPITARRPPVIEPPATAQPPAGEIDRVELSARDRAELMVLLRTLGTDAEPEPLEIDTEETASLQIEVEVETRVDIAVEIAIEGEPPETQAQRQDPLVLDLNGNGAIDLTSMAEGMRFDINGDGQSEQTATVRGGDAFLALDRDGDGHIGGGHELFGDVTGARDGFADLSALDTNADGRIDAKDPRFDDLVVFDGHHTRSLADAGVESIGLEATYASRERADGNAELARGAFRRSDGRLGLVADVLLAYRASASA